MKADLESLKEQASWCLLVNVTGERYYGSFEAMSLKRKKILQRANLILQRAAYFGKTAQQGEKIFVCPIIQLAAHNADIQTIRENRLVPVKSDRVSGTRSF